MDFDALVLGQVDTIRKIGWSRLWRRDEIDDFTQDVITRLYANRTRLRDEERFAQWSMAIARNTSSKWNPNRTPIPVAEPPERQAHEQSQQAHMEGVERASETLAALRALGDDDRGILVAYYMDDATYAELEREYGLSRSGVAMRLQRARQRLRVRLRHMAIALTAPVVARPDRAFGEMPVRSLGLTRAIGVGVAAGCVGGAILAPSALRPDPTGLGSETYVTVSLGVAPTLEDGAALGAPPPEGAPRSASTPPGPSALGIAHTGVIVRIGSDTAGRRPYLRADVLLEYAAGLAETQPDAMARLQGGSGKALVARGLMRNLPTAELIERNTETVMRSQADAIGVAMVEDGFPLPTRVLFTSFVIQG